MKDAYPWEKIYEMTRDFGCQVTGNFAVQIKKDRYVTMISWDSSKSVKEAKS